jgi:dTDP-4-dehydrorhamnose 3,5-epimerase
MIFTETELPGAFVIDLEPHGDERGWFARTWDVHEFRERGLMDAPVQTSASHSAVRGTIRGMHYQAAPFEEAKLVRCSRGAIHDVIIDLRPGSPTFGRHVGFVLSDTNRRMLYVPEGFAHGFQTLEDVSEVTYQMSREYSADHARGVRFDDPAFAIEWPLPVTVVSDRDRSYPDLADVGIEAPAAGAVPSAAGGVGAEIHALVEDLFPICRSITGDGVRETLRRLSKLAPIEVHEVPTGTPVFDWSVPKEWNVREAYIVAPGGERIADLARSNLHLMSYSVPIRAVMPLSELRAHLHSLPDQPDLIPYRTSYYREDWGFCLPHRLVERLEEGEYEVVIDSELVDGHLTYGECFLPGATDDEVLISAHCCHPSLANDNLSGVAVAAHLAKELSDRPRRYSYRFLFAPGTIGAITWLALNEDRASAIAHGVVLACVGDEGPFTYKRSRRGRAPIDRAVEHVLAHGRDPYGVRDFSPFGYDERQFGSPGFDLPVGSLSRSMHGEFAEYHTSADDLRFVTSRALGGSFEVALAVIDVLERDRRYRNLSPKCEPQLGRRGLYHAVGGPAGTAEHELAMLWVLNLSDGDHGLLDIAERSGLPFGAVASAAEALLGRALLEPEHGARVPGEEEDAR